MCFQIIINSLIYQKEQQNDILWLLPPVVHIEKRKQTQCVICNIKDANNALHSQLIGSIGCRGTCQENNYSHLICLTEKILYHVSCLVEGDEANEEQLNTVCTLVTLILNIFLCVSSCWIHETLTDFHC